MCISTKPGVNINPVASISCWPEVRIFPTALIRPSSIATSAVNGADPVPSTIFAFLIYLQLRSMYIEKIAKHAIFDLLPFS